MEDPIEITKNVSLNNFALAFSILIGVFFFYIVFRRLSTNFTFLKWWQIGLGIVVAGFIAILVLKSTFFSSLKIRLDFQERKLECGDREFECGGVCIPDSYVCDSGSPCEKNKYIEATGECCQRGSKKKGLGVKKLTAYAIEGQANQAGLSIPPKEITNIVNKLSKIDTSKYPDIIAKIQNRDLKMLLTYMTASIDEEICMVCADTCDTACCSEGETCVGTGPLITIDIPFLGTNDNNKKFYEMIQKKFDTKAISISKDNKTIHIRVPHHQVQTIEDKKKRLFPKSNGPDKSIYFTLVYKNNKPIGFQTTGNEQTYDLSQDNQEFWDGDYNDDSINSQLIKYLQTDPKVSTPAYQFCSAETNPKTCLDCKPDEYCILDGNQIKCEKQTDFTSKCASYISPDPGPVTIFTNGGLTKSFSTCTPNVANSQKIAKFCRLEKEPLKNYQSRLNLTIPKNSKCKIAKRKNACDIMNKLKNVTKTTPSKDGNSCAAIVECENLPKCSEIDGIDDPRVCKTNKGGLTGDVCIEPGSTCNDQGTCEPSYRITKENTNDFYCKKDGTSIKNAPVFKDIESCRNYLKNSPNLKVCADGFSLDPQTGACQLTKISNLTCPIQTKSLGTFVSTFRRTKSFMTPSDESLKFNFPTCKDAFPSNTCNSAIKQIGTNDSIYQLPKSRIQQELIDIEKLENQPCELAYYFTPPKNLQTFSRPHYIPTVHGYKTFKEYNDHCNLYMFDPLHSKKNVDGRNYFCAVINSEKNLKSGSLEKIWKECDVYKGDEKFQKRIHCMKTKLDVAKRKDWEKWEQKTKDIQPFQH